MRSERWIAALPALAGAAVLGFMPIANARLVPNMVMLCTGQGVRWIPAPPGAPHRDDSDCGKPCHALCQRKKLAHAGGMEEDDCAG